MQIDQCDSLKSNYFLISQSISVVNIPLSPRRHFGSPERRLNYVPAPIFQKVLCSTRTTNILCGRKPIWFVQVPSVRFVGQGRLTWVPKKSRICVTRLRPSLFGPQWANPHEFTDFGRAWHLRCPFLGPKAFLEFVLCLDLRFEKKGFVSDFSVCGALDKYLF